MIKHLKLIALLGALLGLLFVQTVSAEVFRCTDDRGRPLFQDRPCASDLPTLAEAKSKAKAAADSAQRPFMWQSEINGAKVYLLGSIHFGVPEMYPLPNAMTVAFNESDALVVEANILNMDAPSMAGVVASKAMYIGDDTLRLAVTEATWEHLTKVGLELGLAPEMLNKQKPWFAAMTLTALALNQIGFSESLGVDNYFLNQARGAKKILELEGLEWQLGLFDQLSVPDQVQMLEDTLDQIDEAKRYFGETLKAWRSGDAKALHALFEDEINQNEAAQRLNKLVMTDRNYSMTEKIVSLAEQKGGTLFVVVGAGHFTGNEGIIALLKQRGYAVTQM